MVHTTKCFFQEGDVPDRAERKAWYLNKLEQIGEKNYKEHLHCRDNLGNTLLHGAVYADDLDSLKFMVSLETVDLNVRDEFGFTPLMVCLVNHRKPELAVCLIQAGCDVNTKCNDCGASPLMSVASIYHNLEVAHLLIRAGADLNAINLDQNTVLHLAIEAQQYDIICMLLYYGVDADRPGWRDRTPFQWAMASRNTDIQEVLFNYVTDLNHQSGDGNTLLMDALVKRSPYYSQLLDAGADVNASTDSTNSLAQSLYLPDNEAFKRIWTKFHYEPVFERNYTSIFTTLANCSLPVHDWLECLRILLESAQLGDIVQHFYKFSPFHKTLVKLFAKSFFRKGIAEDTFHEYVCVLLARGERVYFSDIEAVYLTYGYGETLKLLLQMDVVPNSCYKWPLLNFMLNFSRGEREVIASVSYRHSLYYRVLYTDDWMWKVLPSFRWYFSRPGTVPQLVELARNASRQAIWLMCQRKSNCQFYAVLRRCKLPSLIKEIIAYIQPIYF